MRGVVVVLLATVVGAVPAAGQKAVNHQAALLTHQREALAVDRRLEKAASLSPAQLKADVAELGKHLDAADGEIADLEKTATGAEKQALASAETHEKEARSHYDELVKAEPSAAGVAEHAKAVDTHLTAAIAADNPHPAAHEAKGKGKTGSGH